jgi:hypothetical protein
MKKKLPMVCVLIFLFLVLDASQIIPGKPKSEISQVIYLNSTNSMKPADNMKSDTLQAAFQNKRDTKTVPYKKNQRIKLLII